MVEATRLACYDSPILKQETLKLGAIDAEAPLAEADGRKFPLRAEFVGPTARD